jgi:hypothetical protein
MPALAAGIHVLNRFQNQDVDGRNKSGHDGEACEAIIRIRHMHLRPFPGTAIRAKK